MEPTMFLTPSGLMLSSTTFGARVNRHLPKHPYRFGSLCSVVWWLSSVCRSPRPVPFSTTTYWWALTGLATYGYNIMKVLGNKITLHSPSRGFSMELGPWSAILSHMFLTIYLHPMNYRRCYHRRSCFSIWSAGLYDNVHHGSYYRSGALQWWSWVVLLLKIIETCAYQITSSFRQLACSWLDLIGLAPHSSCRGHPFGYV